MQTYLLSARDPRGDDDEYHPLLEYVEQLEHLPLPSKYDNIDIDKLWFTQPETIDNIMNNKSICAFCKYFDHKSDPNSALCHTHPILKEFDYVTGCKDIDKRIKCKERNPDGECEMFVLSNNLIKREECARPSVSPVKHNAWKRFLRLIGISD